MKILIDVDALEQSQILTPELAASLRRHAVRDTGSTAINTLLAFGALAIAAGILALNPEPLTGAGLGLAFVIAGLLISRSFAQQWGKLGDIWMIVGALILAGGVGALIDQPLAACLVGAAILATVGLLAESRLLIGLVPVALLAAIGGSTGYWHASYAITIREPTLTIGLFSALAYGAWYVSQQLTNIRHSLGLIFARVCVILVNFGFWVGSLWGDTPGGIWRDPEAWWGNDAPQIPDTAFVVAWLLALLAVGYWGAKTGRRFIVNTATTFGAIHLYTQWFERLGMNPISVIFAGGATVAIGLWLWHYNKKAITQP
jgi:iron complex transport system permease protein